MSWLLHHSFQSIYRNPLGAVHCQEKICLQLEFQKDGPLDLGVPHQVDLVVGSDSELAELLLMEKIDNPDDQGCFYQATWPAPEKPGLYFYYFRLQTESGVRYYGRKRSDISGEGALSEQIPPAYQITVYAEDRKPPQWYLHGMVYQIFPDRFYRAEKNSPIVSSHQRGNRLLHLNWYDDPIYLRDAKTQEVTHWDFFGGNLEGILEKLSYLVSLGVTAIYLNPIFEARSNHKYDTGDYRKIDSMFGDEKIFQRLCQQAKKRGVHIILDGVFSHTGSDSVYFNRYGHYEEKGAYQAVDSPYASWYRFKNHPHDYESWWGIWDLPNLNELDPGFLDFIIRQKDSVLKHWMSLGADGWRLDVADELPAKFIQMFKETMIQTNAESLLLGEVWEDASNKISYGERRRYFLGGELDGTTNYPLRNIMIAFILGDRSIQEVIDQMLTLQEHYPVRSFYAALNVLSTHDTKRLMSVFRGDKRRFMLAVLWQMCMPGVPHLYYGDEAGLRGAMDPENRKPYPWGREDEELLKAVGMLANIRKLYAVLQTGDWVPFSYGASLLCFVRYDLAGKDVFGAEIGSNRAMMAINVGLSEVLMESADVKEKMDCHILYELYPRLRKEPVPIEEPLRIPAGEGKLLITDIWNRTDSSKRQAGVLMHFTSLPSRDNWGSIGCSAREFIDFLHDTKHFLWQFLPIHPPDQYGSPYQCTSSFAGNILLIDLDDLVALGLLRDTDVDRMLAETSSDARNGKRNVLKHAFVTFQSRNADFSSLQGDFEVFCQKQHTWLDDDALYAVLKEHFQNRPWYEWDLLLRKRNPDRLDAFRNLLSREISQEKFFQFLFFMQWDQLKAYAGQRGVSLLGDLPLYVPLDSSDVWCHQELYCLDAEGLPTHVGGVPPDYYNSTGQRWGNPLYDWPVHKTNGYQWWIRRVKLLASRVDIVRFDHFRGLADYWEIPVASPTAELGIWREGPGIEFLHRLEREIPGLDLVVENLGDLSKKAIALKDLVHYPGMLVLQHEMSSYHEDAPMPTLLQKREIFYSGTHDDDTLRGWLIQSKVCTEEYSEKKVYDILSRMYASDVERVIIPLQDLMGLDSHARMNTPGTTEGNWAWKIGPHALSEELKNHMLQLVNAGHRNGSHR